MGTEPLGLVGTEAADVAVVGGRALVGLRELTSDLGALDSRGTWAVVLPFDGPPVCARFDRAFPASGWLAHHRGSRLEPVTGWESSITRPDYAKGVTVIREAIGAGDVYQVNLCRRVSAPVPPGFDVAGLAAALFSVHPAPRQALVRIPRAGVAVASSSPELFLRRRGPIVESQPLKGTAATPGGLSPKDRAENVMIVDLVRNDLGRVCEFGSVEVPALLQVQENPGLVHLASTVRGRLRPGVGWAELIDATFPPGSVTGAPKLAALGVIDALEPVSRGPYCGAVGWVDADRCQGELNVAIRTFWEAEGALHLGTGAGITWDSDPIGEWEETELKAHRLLAVATAGAAAARAATARAAS